jgi:5'-nucleotidase
MSVHDILRLDQVGEDKYVCDGTPVDCVLAGVRFVLDAKPDWILAGINWGYNLGEDVIYSGTVGAAFEGRIQGIKSAALSLHREGDPKSILPWLERFLDNWESIELPPNALWNVNFPENTPKGFKLTTQGRRKYFDMMEQRHDPRGRPYYWIGGDGRPEYEPGEGTDSDAVGKGYISLTPLQMDLTCREIVSKCKSVDW